MMTFLEYANNIQQIEDVLNNLAISKTMEPDELMANLLTIPARTINQLSDRAKNDMSLVLRKILLKRDKSWDRLKEYVKPLWDRSIGPRTLGKDLLNWISAQAMKDINAKFYISYSGNMSKGILYSYTNDSSRVFVSRKDYEWMSYKELYTAIMADYTEKVFNSSK